MATERTFDILETCCFPKGCRIAEDMQPMLATVHIPKLEAAGMNAAEWTRGALMLEEPHFSRVKSVVCRGCRHFECEHNTTPQHGCSGDLLEGIFACGFAERGEANDTLAAAVIPEMSIQAWAAQGICVEKPFVISSRTRFSISFRIEHPVKGKSNIIISRKKGEAGEISVYGSRHADYPLPRTAAELSRKLHDIVNAI